MVQLSHPYMTTGQIIAWAKWTFVGKVMPLCFNILSRLVIAFLPRSKRLLISWLQSPSAVILEPKIIVCHCLHCFPIYLHEVIGPDATIFVFWMLSFNPTFWLSSFTFTKSLLTSSSLSAIRVVSSAYMLLLLSHFSRVQLCATPETSAHQAPLSLGFSRQEHWSGLPFPSPMCEKWKWSRSVVSDS